LGGGLILKPLDQNERFLKKKAGRRGGVNFETEKPNGKLEGFKN